LLITRTPIYHFWKRRLTFRWMRALLTHDNVRYLHVGFTYYTLVSVVLNDLKSIIQLWVDRKENKMQCFTLTGSSKAVTLVFCKLQRTLKQPTLSRLTARTTNLLLSLESSLWNYDCICLIVWWLFSQTYTDCRKRVLKSNY